MCACVSKFPLITRVPAGAHSQCVRINHTGGGSAAAHKHPETTRVGTNCGASFCGSFRPVYSSFYISKATLSLCVWRGDMLWAVASLGLRPREGGRKPADEAPDADALIGELQMRVLGEGHTKKSSAGGVYTLEWKGGGCEQWESFGGRQGVGHTLHSCFERCAAAQKNGAFYRENADVRVRHDRLHQAQ